MFFHQGIWLPDGEKHFPEWMSKNGEMIDGKGTYQIKKLRAALEHCKQFRAAVDVGAHVGLWSLQLAKRFGRVLAFEPVEDFRECYYENLAERMTEHAQLGAAYGRMFHPASPNLNVVLYECALGASPGFVSMKIPELDGGLDTGGTHVGGTGEIEMKTLDSFELDDVDFIKIDCEGYEHHVILGAKDTIKRCQPCIIVEQKPHKLGANFGIKGTPAVDMLREMGAKVVREMSGDHILTF